MKFKLKRVLVMLLLAVMASVVALGKSKRETVTFPNDLNVNGTVVKKGTYEVKFDEQTNELSVLKGSKVIVKVPARVEQGEGKARSFEIRSTGSGDGAQLVAVKFGGSSQNIVLNRTVGQTTGNQ